jgi:D-arabinose 1-dehydrogenase-like Zn-dependent alcohol dehydrogenase
MNSPYHHGNAKIAGSISKGGFAKFWRGPSGYAVKIPQQLDLASAAPMFCGGITVYSPLEDYGAGTKAKTVGVIGIGGLGHYAVMFAKAMGANVTAISRSKDKAEDAKTLGADKYIAMSEGTKGHEGSLDLIICTISELDKGETAS